MSGTHASFDVLVVTYNSADVIESCLESVYSSALPATPVVCVVDNDSRDGTAEVVERRFPHAVLLRNHVNRGFAAANNQASALLSSDFLFLVNPDSQPHPGSFAACLEFMRANPRCGACGGHLLNTAGGSEPSARLFPCATAKLLTLSGLSDRWGHIPFFGKWDAKHLDMRQAMRVDWVPGTFTCFRRSMLREIGFFDERFYLYYEETDLCLRARRNGWEIWCIPEARVTHIGGASSKTRTDQAFDPGGSQLLAFRLRSEFLYHRKNFGLHAVLANSLVEVLWHGLRFALHCRPGPEHARKRAFSANLLRHVTAALRDTRWGSVSPQTPW